MPGGRRQRSRLRQHATARRTRAPAVEITTRDDLRRSCLADDGEPSGSHVRDAHAAAHGNSACRRSNTGTRRRGRSHVPLIRAFVVDDERLAVQRLTRLLLDTGRANVIGGSSDPEEALTTLRDADVDVVFLDIQMPEMNGFELVERLNRHIPVVFTTAY